MLDTIQALQEHASVTLYNICDHCTTLELNPSTSLVQIVCETESQNDGWAKHSEA